MRFLSLDPFVPSGKDFDASKEFFRELGFTVAWDAGDYVGFEREGCSFILQKYNNREFAENFMITIRVDNVTDFLAFVREKKLEEKYGIRVSDPTRQSYGIEVNLIDMAGVCWHFVE